MSTLLSGLGAFVLRWSHTYVGAEHGHFDRDNLWALETGQRSAFRSMLMTECSGMRQVIKNYEVDTDVLQQRLNTALAQHLVLRATVEILEKRIAFLQDRQAQQDAIDAPGTYAGQG